MDSIKGRIVYMRPPDKTLSVEGAPADAKAVGDALKSIEVGDSSGEVVEHINSKDNPHGVTKEQLGLGNVDNTSDMEKPVSDPQKAYFDGIGGGLVEKVNTHDEALKTAMHTNEDCEVTGVIRVPEPSEERQVANRKFVEDSSQRYVRPNLLDNWYFMNPVNRKGKVTADVGKTCIDRWYSIGGQYKLLNGLMCDGAAIMQRVEALAMLGGKRITASLILQDGFVTGSAVVADSVTQVINETGVNLYIDAKDNNVNRAVRITSTQKILAVKMEIGDGQTMCHREGDSWVINHIPDFSESYRNCCGKTEDGAMLKDHVVTIPAAWNGDNTIQVAVEDARAFMDVDVFPYTETIDSYSEAFVVCTDILDGYLKFSCKKPPEAPVKAIVKLS